VKRVGKWKMVSKQCCFLIRIAVEIHVESLAESTQPNTLR
jgi:hypothetical protein